MYADSDISALNSADQSPNHQLPQPHPNNNRSNQQQSHSYFYQQQDSTSCILVDDPPQNPILMMRNNNNNNNKSSNNQQQQAADTNTIPVNNKAASAMVESCPFCSVDAAKLTHEIRSLQHQVAMLSNRIQHSEGKSGKDREKIEACMSQMDEYATGLSVVMKWTKTLGSCLPKLVRGITSPRTENVNNDRQQKSSRRNSLSQHGKPPIAGSTLRNNNNNGNAIGSQEVSAILQNEEDDDENRGPSEFTKKYEHADFPDDDDDDDDEAENPNSKNNESIPVAEVRKMFRTFRDEIIRLRERNQMLERRINDAVCKFEGTNTNKLREEVEGRLRTMMHSLHETMNGSTSPLSELAQQVSSLRTEVELVRSKTEVAATHRAVLETRISDATSKLREVDSNLLSATSTTNYQNQHSRMNNNNNNGSRLQNDQQQQMLYSEEIREIRQAMKELSSTVNHRLENERSAREFDAGDIRSQLRVLLRSPSPMARIGGLGNSSSHNNNNSQSDGMITSSSPHRE